MKVGDKATTKYSRSGSKNAKEIVEIIQVRLKKDGFSQKNYLVKYQDGSLGSWTRWELKKIW
jgi:hypothetical protein